jgi:probable phosphoglycerate mutase
MARHGQDEDNVKGILNGHRDKPLTPLGLEQAVKLAEFIKQKGIIFERVYSSPLRRTLETAQIIISTLDLPEPIILPELIERDFGAMSGQRVADIEKKCAPDIIKTATVTYFLKADRAETFPQLVDRAHHLLSMLKAKHDEGNILLVTHGDFGKMIYAAYYNIPWAEALNSFHFGNTELVLLDDKKAESNFLFKTKQHNK